MSDLGDINLDRQSAPFGGGGATSRGLLMAGVVVLLAGGVGYYFYSQRQAPAEPATAEAPAPAEPTFVARPAPDLPSLGESDTLVRQLLEGLSSRSELATWLANSDLIAAITTIVESLSRGQVPIKALAFLSPTGKFAVLDDGGQMRIDPASYARHDSVGDLVTSLDGPGAARVYDHLRPLFAEAYRMVGRPGTDFDDAVRGALDQILGVPVIDGDIRVVPSGALYKYADARLEAESGVRRQLLRMGARNVRLIQAKAREIADSLAALDGARTTAQP